MKLEVGMYIRTDKGFIAKIKEFKHHYTNHLAIQVMKN